MQTLITERLVLRGWAQNDADDLFEIVGNPKVAAGAGRKPLDNRDDVPGLIDRYSERDNVWALEHRLHKKVIGAIGLSPDFFRPMVDKCKMLTFSLAEPFWGNGYAKEAAQTLIKYAFLHMNLDIVTTNHFSTNVRSKRVIEKCGFMCEGTLRRSIQIYNGQVYDAVSYSLLREEFRNPPATRRRP